MSDNFYHIRFFVVEAVEDALWWHPPDRETLFVSESVVVGVIDVTRETEICNLHA